MAIALELLPSSGLDEAGGIQGRAFFDDPAAQFWFPDDAERRDRLPWLMRVGVALGSRFGQVHTTTGSRLGHAVWLPPGETHLADERLVEAGFVEPEQHMGETSLARFGSFMEQCASAHERLLPGPHWYLLILGVDPPHQGRGVGGALIQPVLATADADRLPCYLETAKERNLAFYRRHAFEVVEELVVDAAGPRMWLMVRPPR